MIEVNKHIKEQNSAHYLTFRVEQGIDVFTLLEYKEMVLESLKFCQKNKGLIIYGWAILSNTLHLIVRAKTPNKLSDVVRDFKKFTSSKIIQKIKSNKFDKRKNWMVWIFKTKASEVQRNEIYKFWENPNSPVLIESELHFKDVLLKIHNLPVLMGIVKNPEDYVFSSAFLDNDKKYFSLSKFTD